MVLKIIRWLRGYVSFTVSGKFPERFLNLISRGGIRYWDIIPLKGGCSGKMLLSDYMSISKISRKAGVRVRSQGGSGLPFFIKKYKKRRGVLIGALCALIITLILSRFIWDISYSGVNRLSTSRLDAVMEESGLKRGMWKNGINVNAVERRAILKMPEIGWISINVINNTATVEIKEKAQRPKLNSDTRPCNIKAMCDGVITRIIVHSGTCQVKKGTAVAENQLLVNSVVEDADNNITYAHCDAEIFADTAQKQVFKVKTHGDDLIPKKNYTQKSRLSFLWFDFPAMMSSSLKGEKGKIYSAYSLTVNQVRLPLGHTVEKTYYFNTVPRSIDKPRAERILKKQMALYECFSPGEGVVKSRKLTFSQSKDSFILEVDYVINKNISVTQPINVEK